MVRKLFVILTIILTLLFLSCELIMTPPERGKMNIIVVGFDSFGSDDYITGTIEDAFQTGRALEALCNKTGIENNVKYLLGNNIPNDIKEIVQAENIEYFAPTKENLNNALDSIESDKNDTTVIFFATHGLEISGTKEYDEDLTEEGALVLLDSKDNSNHDLLYYRDFLDSISYLNGKKLIILDICHGGAMIETGNVSINENSYSSPWVFDLLFDNNAVPYYSPYIFVLSSTNYSQSAVSTYDGSHGAFTYKLLEGLGWDEESQKLYNVIPAKSFNSITVSDLAKYCLQDGEPDQTPITSGSSEDLLLFQF